MLHERRKIVWAPNGGLKLHMAWMDENENGHEKMGR